MSPDAIVIPDDLVSAARSGDPAALSRLWDLCAPILCGALRRHAGRVGDADVADLAQEAAVLFLELLRSDPSLAPAEPFGERFGRKLYWRMRDYVRSERRRLGRQVAASEDDLEAALRRRAGGAPPGLPGRKVDRALARLPARQRAVISGLYFEDRTTRAVAGDLGISHRAVEALRRRAFAALRALLTEEAADRKAGGGKSPIEANAGTNPVGPNPGEGGGSAGSASPSAPGASPPVPLSRWREGDGVGRPADGASPPGPRSARSEGEDVRPRPSSLSPRAAMNEPDAEVSGIGAGVG